MHMCCMKIDAIASAYLGMQYYNKLKASLSKS